MPCLLVCPLKDIETTATHYCPSHMISLVDASMAVNRPPMIAKTHHLILTMNDIAINRPGLTAPEEGHIETLLDFVKKWASQPAPQPLLIHCWMGISRSPAAAFIIACTLNPHRTEQEIAHELRFHSASATPNPRLIALADSKLERQGRMIEAIKVIGRGAQASNGEPFSWKITL